MRILGLDADEWRRAAKELAERGYRTQALVARDIARRCE